MSILSEMKVSTKLNRLPVSPRIACVRARREPVFPRFQKNFGLPASHRQATVMKICRAGSVRANRVEIISGQGESTAADPTLALDHQARAPDTQAVGDSQ